LPSQDGKTTTTTTTVPATPPTTTTTPTTTWQAAGQNGPEMDTYDIDDDDDVVNIVVHTNHHGDVRLITVGIGHGGESLHGPRVLPVSVPVVVSVQFVPGRRPGDAITAHSNRRDVTEQRTVLVVPDGGRMPIGVATRTTRTR
jgi:hypothetical protein